jgi:predicted nucleic acid-binding protein
VIVFVDSSAYLKLFLDEAGADAVRAAWTLADGAMAARLTYVEVLAGLSQARRDGRLAHDGYERTLAAFIDTWAEVDVLELDAATAPRAGVVADAYGLRAGDAIQLAAALEGGDVMMVAFDRRLRAAATAAGLSVYPESA